jgi:hypothetical protein
MRVIALLLVLGCSSRADYIGGGGEYTRDDRTGLCFAFWISGTSSGVRETVTNVPCSPEVLKLVEEGRKPR